MVVLFLLYQPALNIFKMLVGKYSAALTAHTCFNSAPQDPVDYSMLSFPGENSGPEENSALLRSALAAQRCLPVLLPPPVLLPLLVTRVSLNYPARLW